MELILGGTKIMINNKEKDRNLVREQLSTDWINKPIVVAKTTTDVRECLSFATDEIVVEIILSNNEIVLSDENELDSKVLGVALIIPNLMKVYIPLCNNNSGANVLSAEKLQINTYIVNILREKLQQLKIITDNTLQLYSILYVKYNINCEISRDTALADSLFEREGISYCDAEYLEQLVSLKGKKSLLMLKNLNRSKIITDDIAAALADYKITKTYYKYKKQMDTSQQYVNGWNEQLEKLNLSDKEWEESEKNKREKEKEFFAKKEKQKQDRKIQLIFHKYKLELKELNIKLDPLLYKNSMFDCLNFIDNNTGEDVNITAFKKDETETILFQIEDYKNREYILLNGEGNTINVLDDQENEKKVERFRELTKFEQYCTNYLINNKELSYAIIMFNLL